MMRYPRLLLLLALALVVLASACTATPEVPVPTPTLSVDAPSEPGLSDPEPTETAIPTVTAEPVAAIINGEAISLETYERQITRYEASMVAAGQDLDTPEGQQARSQGRQWVLDMMIEQKLIEQAAVTEGITITDEQIEATLDSLRTDIGGEAFESWLEQEGITLDEMRAQLRQDMLATQMANRVAETIPAQAEHVHARHILVSTPEEAQLVLSQLQAGGDFAALARTYSQDMSTRDLGGDLGFFPMGVLTSKEVEAAAFALQPGQLSDVIQSELGYHIVQVVERVPDREIEQENLRLLRDQAVRTWLDELQSSADIQVFIAPES